jgi:nucleoside-diphosphate kinase
MFAKNRKRKYDQKKKTVFFMRERTLVILKPCTVQRGLIGEIISRFERKGLILVGMKMTELSDAILTEHYAHLKDKPFFQRIKDSMRICPVIVCCWEGVEAVSVVRTLTGSTNGRSALPGTIRGDYSMSIQENIVHASDSPETAAVELKRFFNDSELFNYNSSLISNLYATGEI